MQWCKVHFVYNHPIINTVERSMYMCFVLSPWERRIGYVGSVIWGRVQGRSFAAHVCVEAVFGMHMGNVS